MRAGSRTEDRLDTRAARLTPGLTVLWHMAKVSSALDLLRQERRLAIHLEQDRHARLSSPVHRD